MPFEVEAMIGDPIASGVHDLGIEYPILFLGSFVDGARDRILVLSHTMKSWQGTYYYNIGKKLPAEVSLGGVEFKVTKIISNGNQIVTEVEKEPPPDFRSSLFCKS